MNCCGKPIKIFKNVDFEGSPGIGLICDECDQRAMGRTQEDAEKKFKPRPAQATTPKKENRKPVNNNQNLPAVKKLDQSALMTLASPIMGDSSAVERLMKNNVRYVENLKGYSWDKIWKENPSSIIHATEEAMILGAELGKMGDIVPYGSTCEFIPSIEAYEFALTNGKNAPFENLEIECIHENDTYKIGRKDGDFFIDVQMGIPRGEVIAVAVYGAFNRDGKVRGEVYDSERLMQKAVEHSTSYQYYLNDMRYAEQLKSEGKIQTENGREYFEKTAPGKNGTTYQKKVYLDQLTNPYAGADRPEMLRKAAGKSYCRKYARVRNAEAAMQEIKTHNQAVKRSMDYADKQFDTIDQDGME